MSSSTTPRSQEEMIAALRKQVRLLTDYARKVFVEKNLDYVGEIASKLRLLATNFRSNEPLLLRLMNETGIQPKRILGGPPIPLTPAGQRAGGSHEDWEMDEMPATILSTPVFIMGLPGVLTELRTSVDAVLDVAERLLTQLDDQTKNGF